MPSESAAEAQDVQTRTAKPMVTNGCSQDPRMEAHDALVGQMQGDLVALKIAGELLRSRDHLEVDRYKELKADLELQAARQSVRLDQDEISELERFLIERGYTV